MDVRGLTSKSSTYIDGQLSYKININIKSYILSLWPYQFISLPYIDRKNMHQLPQHNVFTLSDLGIHLRRVSPLQDNATPMYSHQDDYYIIGLVEQGIGCCIIDFKEITISQGDLFLIQPRQVHRFVRSKDAVGWVLFADCSFIGNEAKRILDKFQLFASTIKIDERKMNELKQMASILAYRINEITDELKRATVRKLAEAYINIVAESIQEIEQHQTKYSHRHIEIVMSFFHLLTEHITVNRSPSYYASLLNISPVYLNEIVKKVTGINTTLYIRNELILQAKRLLVHTNLAIKEVSNKLGIDDYAYFSRIFTQTTGISPSAFRMKNLK